MYACVCVCVFLFLCLSGADASLRLYRVSDPLFPIGDSRHSPSTAITPLIDLPAAHEAGINDIVFTADSKYILTASDDKTIIIWEIESGKPLRTYRGHTSYVFCVNVSSHGNLLVSGSYDETVRVWDLKNAKCIRVINAHSDPVSAVDFNKEGTLIVSSSYDGLWSHDTPPHAKTHTR